MALRTHYPIRNEILQKVGLYSEDVGLLVAAALDNPISSQVSVQVCVLLLLILHTGG